MSEVKKLASQTAVYGFSSMARLVSTLVLVPLQSRVMSEEQNGVVSFYYSLVGFALVLLSYGMETAFFRFTNQKQDSRMVFNTAFGSLLISTALFVVFGWLGAYLIAAWLGFEGQVFPVKLLVLILALDTLCALPFAWLRLHNRAGRFALGKMLGIAVNLLLNLVWLWVLPALCEGSMLPAFENTARLLYQPGREVEYVFLANFFGSLATFLWVSPVLRQYRPRMDAALLRQLFAYGWPLIFVGLAGIANETLDRVMLRYLLPADVALEQVGIYSTCYKLSIFLSIFVQAFRFAAEPFFFRKSGDGDARQTYSLVMDWFVAVCSFIFLAICVFMDVARHFIDEKFWVGLHVVPVLLMANLCLGVYINLSIWYKLSDRTRMGSYVAVGGALLTTLLLLVFIPVFGYTAAAWVTLVCYAGMAVAAYVLGQRFYPVPYRVVTNLGVVLLALGLWLWFTGWQLQGFTFWAARFGLLSGFALLVYFLVLKPKSASST